METKPENSIRQVNPEFRTHVLNEGGIEKAGKIAELFNGILSDLGDLCPQKTREFSIVKTKLEEACFFAKKAMSGDSGNHRDNSEVIEKAA